MAKSLKELKVLILHPFMNYYGGAEYTLDVVANLILPQADIFTLSYSPKVLAESHVDKKRVTAPAGNLLHPLFRAGTPIYPAIIDTLQPSEDYDVVLSFSYAYVHGAVTSHLQPHISFIHSPMRLLWMHEDVHYWYNKVPLLRDFYQLVLSSQRNWDIQAGARPDYLLSASVEVQSRISAFWGRGSEVIYPPVDVEFYADGAISENRADYYVTHSRLVHFKRVDILIEAFKKLQKKLVIIGDGPEYRSLRNLARGYKNIVFTGHIADSAKRRALLQQAKGYVYASFEDFGISPVEAMAAGLPVLAFGKGGVLETVDSRVGILFPEQNPASLHSAFTKFESFCEQVDRKTIIDHARKFDKQIFIQKFSKAVLDKIQDFQKNGPPTF